MLCVRTLQKKVQNTLISKVFRKTPITVRHANVLIVDEDPDVRLELRTLLSALGHSVIGDADSGGQALLLARSLKPDVVLMNLVLGSPMSGLDVARTVATERIAPVILFSGNVSADALAVIDASGAMGFLSKPVRIADMAPTIAIAMARFKEVVTLEIEIRSLNERMEARKLVGRAKAILMEKHGLTEREAFYRIQTQSTALNKPSHEIARAIITASELAG